MKIPKYVIEMMSRAEYNYKYSVNDKNYAAGYTLNIFKASPYTKVETLEAEIKKLVAWANKNGGEGTAYILGLPFRTHHYDQSAIVTIFDPVMKEIEKYIVKGRDKNE